MVDENEYKGITGALIESLLKAFSEFNEIVKKNHFSLNKEAKLEYLHFLLFLLVDNFQKWKLESKYLDVFMKDAYRNFILKGMLSNTKELRDFEVQSRKRWLYYYNFIGEKEHIKADYSTHKKLTQLVGREAIFLSKLISGKDGDAEILIDLSKHLYCQVFAGLILQQSLSMKLLYRKTE